MNDKVQIFITVLFVTIYAYMVVIEKANVEGFCVLATYIVKKALDLVEIEKSKEDSK